MGHELAIAGCLVLVFEGLLPFQALAYDGGHHGDA